MRARNRQVGANTPANAQGVARQMGARSRHECGEPRKPVLGGEQHVPRAIAEGCEFKLPMNRG